jgi:molybdopterin converting factor small subunit
LKIEVLFFGRARSITGSARKMVTISDGVKLADLFRLLDCRYDNKFTNEFLKVKGLMVMINGRHYTAIGGMEAPLHDKDTVAIMPVVVGG